MIEPDRAERAFTDVLAVEYDPETDMARVVTMSDCYDVDMRETRHVCPDREYNDVAICKHLVASEVVRGQLDVPGGWFVTDSLDERTDETFQIDSATDQFPDFEDFMTDDKLMTDGGQVQGAANQPEGIGKFTLWNAERENARHFDSKSEAEAKQDELSGLMDVEMFPPGESPEALYGRDDGDESDDDSSDDEPTEDCAICGDEVPISEARAGPEGQPIHGECYSDDGASDADVAESVNGDGMDVDVVDHAPDAADDAPDPAPEPDAAHDPEVLSADEIEQYAADLEDRDVGTDPLKWMPGEFVDEIDGTQAINRRGFEVLAHFYNVEVRTDIQVPPEDTGHEYCRVEATARTADGREVNAHGSAHLDRGDDSYLLLEMAETRARKRALSIATGSGAVAVSELQNEVQQ